MSIELIKAWVDRVSFPTADDDSPGDRMKAALLTAVEALNNFDMVVDHLDGNSAGKALASICETLGIEKESL